MLDGMLGHCTECGIAVFENSEYYYDSQQDEYYHMNCLPDSKRGCE